MAKKKIEVPPEGAATREELDPAELVASGIASAVGEDATAMVYLQRQDPETKDWRHLRRFTPGEFDVDAVRELFGGGDYRVRIKNRQSQFLGAAMRFSIEGEPLAPEHGRPVVGVLPQAPAGASSDKLLDAMLQIGTAFVAAYANRPQPQAVDPVALVREMAAASKEGTKELAEMVGLRNELASGQKKEGDLAQALEVLKMGMRIGRGMSDGGEGGGTFGKLLETLSPILNKAVANASAPAGNPPLPPTPSTPEPPPVPKHPLVAGFEILLDAAQGGSHQPEAYAEIAAERAPGLIEALDAAIAEAGSVEALLTQVSRMDPRVVAHIEFFRAAVLYLTEPDDGAATGDDETNNDAGEGESA